MNSHRISYVVRAQELTVLQLFPKANKTLLLRINALPILDKHLHVVNCGTLQVYVSVCYVLPIEGLDEYRAFCRTCN